MRAAVAVTPGIGIDFNRLDETLLFPKELEPVLACVLRSAGNAGDCIVEPWVLRFPNGPGAEVFGLFVMAWAAPVLLLKLIPAPLRNPIPALPFELVVDF